MRVQHGPCKAQATPIPHPPRHLHHPHRYLAMMTARHSLSVPPKQKQRPPPWRKPEDEELREEICDLENDIAVHSEAHSDVLEGRSLAHSEQPEVQECGNDKVIDLSQETHNLEHDIVPSLHISSHGTRALKHVGGHAG